MPISFIPYQKEYAEQIKILAALLEGELHPARDPGSQTTSPYPRLTGTFQRRPVGVEIAQETTKAGSDPLSTDKYLLIHMRCSCSLEMKIGPKNRLGWLDRLIWWRHICTGNKIIDDTYAITSAERLRSRRLLSHKKIKSLLLQLSSFHSLQLTERNLCLRRPITSHQTFVARNLAATLQQLARLARLCENLA